MRIEDLSEMLIHSAKAGLYRINTTIADPITREPYLTRYIVGFDAESDLFDPVYGYPEHVREDLPQTLSTYYLHNIHTPDKGPHHDHPWSGVTTILRGFYEVNELYFDMDLDSFRMEPFARTLRSVEDRTRLLNAYEPPTDISQNTVHRINSVAADTWTLIRLDRAPRRPWGFYIPTDNDNQYKYMNSREYFAKHGARQ